MNDTDLINAGYQANIKQLYADFFASYTGTRDPAQRQQIEQRFVLGITTARQVRDRALALLP
jgi:hypothetical protein